MIRRRDAPVQHEEIRRPAHQAPPAVARKVDLGRGEAEDGDHGDDLGEEGEEDEREDRGRGGVEEVYCVCVREVSIGWYGFWAWCSRFAVCGGPGFECVISVKNIYKKSEKGRHVQRIVNTTSAPTVNASMYASS